MHNAIKAPSLPPCPKISMQRCIVRCGGTSAASRRVCIPARAAAAGGTRTAPAADPAVAASVKEQAAAYVNTYALPHQQALIAKVSCGGRRPPVPRATPMAPAAATAAGL